MDVLMFLCFRVDVRLTAATLKPDPNLKDETFSWKPHLHIIRSSNVPLYKKRSFKEKYWEMGLFISFNLFCHIFVRPDK